MGTATHPSAWSVHRGCPWHWAPAWPQSRRWYYPGMFWLLCRTADSFAGNKRSPAAIDMPESRSRTGKGHRPSVQCMGHGPSQARSKRCPTLQLFSRLTALELAMQGRDTATIPTNRFQAPQSRHIPRENRGLLQVARKKQGRGADRTTKTSIGFWVDPAGLDVRRPAGNTMHACASRSWIWHAAMKKGSVRPCAFTELS